MDRKKGNLTKSYKDVINSIEWVKVVAVGDMFTGKTSLIKIICQNTEDDVTDYNPTVGVDYGFKIQDVDDKKVRVHLWDLSGDPNYFEVRKELYSGADIILFLFDVTRPETFHHLNDWISEVTEFPNPPDQCPTMAVLGNKIDLNRDRLVSAMEGKHWSLENKLRYYDTSAVKGIGVDKMIVDLVKDVLEYRKKKQSLKEIGKHS